jgi:hypothetical protein
MQNTVRGNLLPPNNITSIIQSGPNISIYLKYVKFAGKANPCKLLLKYVVMKTFLLQSPDPQIYPPPPANQIQRQNPF